MYHDLKTNLCLVFLIQSEIIVPLLIVKKCNFVADVYFLFLCNAAEKYLRITISLVLMRTVGTIKLQMISMCPYDVLCTE